MHLDLTFLEIRFSWLHKRILFRSLEDGHDEIISTLLVLWKGNPFVTGGFPSQRVSNAELWCFFVASLTKLLNDMELPVLWDARTLIWPHYNERILFRFSSGPFCFPGSLGLVGLFPESLMSDYQCLGPAYPHWPYSGTWTTRWQERKNACQTGPPLYHC